MPIILERPPSLPATATEPVLAESPRRLAVGGSSRDNVITVIENPITTEGRFMGVLFAERFIDRSAAVRYFQDVNYFRLDLHNSAVAEVSEPWHVNMKQGGGLTGRTLYYLETLGMAHVLPNRTELQYELAFLQEGLYEGLLEQFSNGKAFPDAIKDFNSAFARRVESFGIDSRGSLVFPPGYAAVPPAL